jgi:release factor family 7
MRKRINPSVLGRDNMTILRKKDLKRLMDKYEGPCVSIFMPTHRGRAESQQDQIRFKNLFREAEEGLLQSGLRSPHVNDLLKPAQKLLTDASFWQQQIDGLAVFLCQNVFRYFRFPHRFEELVVVADRFHLKPLLPLLSGDERFYILALSQNQVRLLQGTRFSISGIKLEGVPESLADVLKFDGPEKQLQLHTGAAGSNVGHGAIFHGHGMGTDDAKDNIMQYFRQIDKGLRQIVKEEQVPLVLAGVEYLFPIYREANTYPHLVHEGVTGNPEGLSAKDLHEHAWSIVEPLFQKAERGAVEKYKRFAGTAKTSSDVRKIVPASYHGRVDLLFVAVGVQHWGTFDPVNNMVHLHEEEQIGDADLLDFAAIQTFLQQGSVYAVKPDHIPDEAPLAAVFRY